MEQGGQRPRVTMAKGRVHGLEHQLAAERIEVTPANGVGEISLGGLIEELQPVGARLCQNCLRGKGHSEYVVGDERSSLRDQESRQCGFPGTTVAQQADGPAAKSDDGSMQRLLAML